MTKDLDPSVRPDLEGFLDDRIFNGVIFLLREPNTGKGCTQKEFWFKKRLPKDYKYPDQQTKEESIKNRNDKTARTKYRNRFEEMLTYVFPGSDEELHDEKRFRSAYYEKLCHAAYFNLCPDSGNSSRSETYDKLLNDPDYVTNRFYSIINYCKIRTAGELTVFTCSDIFQKLTEYNAVPGDLDPDGVDYGKGNKMKLFKWNEPNHFGIPITVYEITHPSRSPKLKLKR